MSRHERFYRPNDSRAGLNRSQMRYRPITSPRQPQRNQNDIYLRIMERLDALERKSAPDMRDQRATTHADRRFAASSVRAATSTDPGRRTEARRRRSPSTPAGGDADRGIHGQSSTRRGSFEYTTTRSSRPSDDRRPSGRDRTTSRVRFASYEDSRRARIGRRTPSTSSTSSLPAEPENFFRSENPDFRSLIQHSFRYVQVSHHMENWGLSCPRSIAANIDNLVSDIHLPHVTETLRNAFVDAANAFKTAILNATNTHLAECLRRTRQQIDNLQKQDIDSARRIVEQHLIRRLGKKATQSFVVRDALDDIMPLADHSTSTHTTSPTAGKRRRIDTGTDAPSPSLYVDSTRPPIRTPPISSPDTAVTGAMQPSPSVIEPSPPQQPVRRTSPCFDARPTSGGMPPLDANTERPDPYTSRDRTRFQQQSAFSTDDDIETMPLRGSVKTHLPMHRRKWKITTTGDAHTIVVADSNGASWNNDDLPPGMHVDAFRGAHLKDAADLLEAATARLQNVDRLVLAVGFNDRSSTAPDEAVLQMQRICDWGSHYHTRIAFTEIPILPTVPPQDQDTIRHLNIAAREVFGADFVEIDQTEVFAIATDVTGCHYTVQTAKSILSMVTRHFLP